MNKKKEFIIAGSIITVIISIIIGFILFNNKPITYDIFFETNGGSLVESQVVNEGELVKKPINPTKNGYKFVEWTYQGRTYDFNLEVTSNLNLIAKWEKLEDEILTFTIKFETDGGTTISNQVVEKGNKVEKPTDPVKEGNTFGGWVLNEEVYDFNKIVEKDIVLKANWKKNYTVTFNSNGGSVVSSQTVTEGDKVLKPKNPTRTGYTFGGWALNDDVYDFNKAVEKDIELKANWKKNYTVTFNSNGGSVVSSQTVTAGSKVSKPKDPTKKYYKLVEWQLNGKKYNFNQEINSNITLKAIWKENLPTNLPEPKIEVIGSLFHRDEVVNTKWCEYVVKLTNYKDYLYQKEDGSSAYFINDFTLLEIDGGFVTKNYIEESFVHRVICGETVDFYIEYARIASDGTTEAKVKSKTITLDTKADLTPTLELGKIYCGYYGCFRDFEYEDGIFKYRLDVFHSIKGEFIDGNIEIYEKVDNNYVSIGLVDGIEAGLIVEIPANTVKTYVARAFIENDELGKVYGNYSNELVIDTSKEEIE